MVIKRPINIPFQDAEALLNQIKWIRPIFLRSRRSNANWVTQKYFFPMWQSAALNRRWYDEPAPSVAGGTWSPAAVVAAALTALTTGTRKQRKLSQRWQPRQQRQHLHQQRAASIYSISSCSSRGSPLPLAIASSTAYCRQNLAVAAAASALLPALPAGQQKRSYSCSSNSNSGAAVAEAAAAAEALSAAGHVTTMSSSQQTTAYGLNVGLIA